MKRYRATAIVSQNSKLLLVRDRGCRTFSMPGGGFKRGESTIQAGIREIREEVGGLTILSAKRLPHCDFEERRTKHKVLKVIVEGHPHIMQPHEINKVIWWNKKNPLPVQRHVVYILSKLKRGTRA